MWYFTIAEKIIKYVNFYLQSLIRAKEHFLAIFIVTKTSLHALHMGDFWKRNKQKNKSMKKQTIIS